MLTRRESDARTTVLIAEDDSLTRAHLQALLTGAGYEVVACADGQEAIAAARDRGVHLALLDGVMPNIGGLECCRMLKAMHQEHFLPVILFAAQGDPASRVEGLKNGADDFVPKPFDDAELLARVENMIRIKRMHDAVQGAKSRLEALAGRDETAALFTEPYIRSRLHQEYRRSERYQDPLSFVLLHPHGMGDILFEHGEDVANAVFSELAARTAKQIRETDIGARFQRFMMAVVLPSTHFQGSLIVAERLHRAIAGQPVTVDRKTFTVPLSMGISLFPSRNVKASTDLIAAAEDALAQLKGANNDHICVSQHEGYFFRPRATPVGDVGPRKP